MAVFLITLALICFIHRELLTYLAVFLSKARKIELESFSFRIRAQLRTKPKIYLAEANFIETFSLGTLTGPFLIVDQNLWASLSNEEREAYLAWSISANLRASTIERLLFRPRIETLDRDTALLSSHPLSVSSLLKKVIDFRLKTPPSSLGHWLTGLSFLGPSLLGEWPSHDQRMLSLASHLADLTKSK